VRLGDDIGRGRGEGGGLQKVDFTRGVCVLFVRKGWQMFQHTSVGLVYSKTSCRSPDGAVGSVMSRQEHT